MIDSRARICRRRLSGCAAHGDWDRRGWPASFRFCRLGRDVLHGSGVAALGRARSPRPCRGPAPWPCRAQPRSCRLTLGHAGRLRSCRCRGRRSRQKARATPGFEACGASQLGKPIRDLGSRSASARGCEPRLRRERHTGGGGSRPSPTSSAPPGRQRSICFRLSPRFAQSLGFDSVEPPTSRVSLRPGAGGRRPGQRAGQGTARRWRGQGTGQRRRI